MQTVEQKLAALEARLNRLEDERAIIHLMSAYGPAVDGCLAEEVAGLWTDTGVYDAQLVVCEGRAGLEAMVRGDMHQEIVKGGSAHVIGLPLIEIDGDSAVATCYARLYRWNGDAFSPWRVSANRWEFVRTPQGWRVTNRVNRRLDGSQDARDLLARGAKSALRPR